MSSDSFYSWLVSEVMDVLRRSPGSGAPFMVWCDPDRQWLGPLRAAATAGKFELWAPESADKAEHELLIRERFHREPFKPRVVWLPVSRDDITFFKVFELQAEEVWEKSLVDAVRAYGVRVPREQESKWTADLPQLVRQLGDQPRTSWDEGGNTAGRLLEDRRLLKVIAGPSGEFDRLRQEGLFDVFVRRATEDFAFSDPTGKEERSWRIETTARLLCTEAAEASPHDLPREPDRILPSGSARARALELLESWRNDMRFSKSFEELVVEADRTVGLGFWARNLSTPPKSRGSREVERELFERAVARLDRIEQVDLLATELGRDVGIFQDRADGFWGKVARDRIGWAAMATLGEVASVLASNGIGEPDWTSAEQAIAWYRDGGWRIDMAGERLFVESPDLPPQLSRIRARLRRAFLSCIHRVGRAFSDILARHPQQVLSLPSAGETALKELESAKTPTALIFLDACRMDLGQRLAEMLNEGEPIARAMVSVAVAPLPSITALGMAFALPMPRKQLAVSFSSKGASLTTSGFKGDLTRADDRKKWLTENNEAKEHYRITDIRGGEINIKAPSKTRRVIAVYAAELDRHDGELQITGADDHLRGYVQAIRRLREAGWSRIIILTDHGFFHTQADEQEPEKQKPTGEVLWESRRAIVGHDLKHPTALLLGVSGSDLKAAIPRSTSWFEVPGGMKFMHGGATLQERIIPVVVATWPAKAHKAKVLLDEMKHVTSLTPWVKLRAAAGLFGATDSTVLSREVIIEIKEAATGRTVFRHDEPVIVKSSGEEQTIRLMLAENPPTLPTGASMVVEVRDADDDELLIKEPATLEVNIDEW